MAQQDPNKLEKINKLLSSSKTLSDNLGISFDDIANIQQKILDGNIKNEAAILKALTAINKQIKAKEKLKKLDSDILDIAGDMKKSLLQLGKLRKIDEKTGKMAYKTQVDSLKSKMKEVLAAKKSGDLDANAARQQMGVLVSSKKMIESLAVIEDKSPALAAGLQMAAEEAEGLQSGIDNFFSSIPGGEFIKNKLGLDKVGEQVQKGLVNGIGAMGDALKAGASPMQALRTGMSAFNKTAMLNPVLLIVTAIILAVAAIKKLVALASAHEKKARETAEAMGISVSAGKEMVNNAYKAASGFGVQLVNAKEVLSVQKELSESLGNSSMISAEVAAQVADTGKSFGFGVKAAAELQATLQGVGMESAAAAEFQKELAAEATKAGLDTGKIVADISKNAKDTAKFFGGNVKALKNAAIEANKLGMSISDMASISDNLLNFEKSIASQFELQAMTGKQINFDKARQLALEGDIAGATKEVLSQVGDIDDFNKMSVLQRKKLAEATGMDVDQLQKSLAIQKAMPNAQADQLKLLQKSGLSAEEIQNMSADQLQNKLADMQASEKSAKAMENMKALMQKSLLPLGEAFAEIFAALSPILKLIGVLFKGIGYIVKGIGIIIDYAIVKPIESIMDAFSSVGSFLGGLFGGSSATPAGGNVQGLASGGNVTSSGAFMVGEQGPEMVNLQAGSAVTPNNQLSGGNGVVKAIETTNALLRELISAGSTIEMDGQTVGAVLRTTDSFRRR